MDFRLEEFEEAVDRVNRALKYLTQVFIGRQGLSLSRYRILRYLQRRSDVNMGEMQAHLLVAGPTLTELVDGLVQDGLVQRVRDQVDRRMIYLRLTGAGREAYREILAFRCACLKKALHGEESGLEDINAVLNGVYKGLKQQITVSGENVSSRPAKERCDKNFGF